MKRQLTPPAQPPEFPETRQMPCLDTSSGKLVQNFLTALHTNYENSQSHLSCVSTTTSVQTCFNQNKAKSSNSSLPKLKETQDFLDCQQQIQIQTVTATPTKLKWLSNQLNRIQINPIYFVKHQGIKTSSRSILMDWITELCQEFRFLRVTCSQTKTLVDVYLSQVSRVPLNRLQLVGITCLLIISKIQESIPKTLVEMANATACLYNVDQIRKMQMEILSRLSLEVQFLCYEDCIDFILNQWQNFKQQEVQLFQFALNSEEPPLEYLQENLRWMWDVMVLDSESLNYNYLTLSVSVLVLLLGYGYGWLSFEEIQYSFVYNCRYLVNTPTYFLNKIQIFLNKLKLTLGRIFPPLQFASSYFFLVNLQESPHYVQVHNSSSLHYVKHRRQLIRQMQSIFQ